MLNTSVKVSNNVIMNQAVSGVLQKTHVNSVFKHCHNKSRMADTLFSKGTLTDDYKAKEFIILQVMLMSENWLMIEMVDKDLYYEKEETKI